MAGTAAGARRRAAGADADADAARGGRPLLLDYVDRRVGVLTNDGRIIVGRLRGFDQVCNVVLDGCVERVFAAHAGVETVPHGVYVLRGDNMCVVVGRALRIRFFGCCFPSGQFFFVSHRRAWSTDTPPLLPVLLFFLFSDLFIFLCSCAEPPWARSIPNVTRPSSGRT
jgi:small nuclear ribonucleoprotein (snRNP)-like protein